MWFFYRIDGPHNKTVLAAIHAEMREHDEDCSFNTIRSKIISIPIQVVIIAVYIHRCFGHIQKESVP